jgi:hypothetical protein
MKDFRDFKVWEKAHELVLANIAQQVIAAMAVQRIFTLDGANGTPS